MTTNPNIIRLLEMLDNPEAYSEQEIDDIIHADDETRDAYRLMVAAKQGYIHKKAQPQAAEAREPRARPERADTRLAPTIPKQPNDQYPKRPANRWITKAAAVFIGILLVSGMAYAAIHLVRQRAEKADAVDRRLEASAPTMRTRTSAFPADSITPTPNTQHPSPIVYDNIPLEKMLTEIAAHYKVEVVFRNEAARQLRFHFVWEPQQSLEQVVSDLNHFEHLNVTVKDNQIIVE